MTDKEEFMKKVFALCIVLTLFAAVLCAHASAAQSVPVDIWVNIENGGTAVIIPEVNSPLADKSSVTLDNGQSEAFHIEFSEVGSYSYTVRIEPDEREIRFDDTIYHVNVFVKEENGKLYTSVVIYNEKTGKKYSPESVGEFEPCTVSFVNGSDPDEPDKPESTTTPDETKPVPDTTSDTERTPGTGDKGSDNTSRPQTGDDSQLDFYLLLAILASAGLFMLSLLYYRSVVREIRKR